MKSDCIRAGNEMSKEEWFSVPLALRQRYWRETDYGKKLASTELIAAVKEALGAE